MCKPSVETASDDALIAHIQRVHHAFLKLEVPALHALFERVAASHECYELDEAMHLFENLADELLGHACKEQNVLFPMLQSLSPGVVHPIWRKREIGNVMRTIHAERASMRAGFIRLRSLTKDYAPDPFCHHYTALMTRLAYFERVVLEQMNEEEVLFRPVYTAH